MALDIDWRLVPLGKMPDAKVAKLVGCGWRTVFRARTKLMIPAWQSHADPPRDRIPKAALGTKTDEEIAREYGCRAGDVYLMRVRHRVKPSRPRRGGGRGRGSSILTERRRQLLGKISDMELARRWGVHFSAVRHHRVRLGIPAYNHEQYAKQIQWKRGDAALIPLGVATDREISETLGIAESSVSDIRKQFKIRPARSRPFCPCGRPARRLYCSMRCHDRVQWGKRGVVIINPSTKKQELIHEIDGIAFALAVLSKSIADRNGSNWHNRRIT